MARTPKAKSPARTGGRHGVAVVVELAALRQARHARDVLLQLLGPVPWLLSVKVEVQPSGVPWLVATVVALDHWKNACVPSQCNNVEVLTKDAAGGPQL